jgi:hypothetical protein
MPGAAVPCRGFTNIGADTLPKGWYHMDIVAIAFGIAIFVALILYVPACEKV